MDRCDACYKEREFRERYALACQRFDKALNIAMIITVISLGAAVISIILTTICVAKTLEFINGFEYVEETVVEQDGDGQNVAVFVDNSTKEG